jgi:imidazolonepropionase
MKCYKDLNQIITLSKAKAKNGRKLSPEDLDVIHNGAVVFNNDEILWCGKTESIPQQYQDLPTHSLSGHVLTPEIVDSHTHLVFGGNRAFEYSLRLNGADYEEIARQGGGILSTMKNTLTEDFDSLLKTAVARIERISSYGVGSIEIKSGYALTYEKEKEITRLIHMLKDHFRGKLNIFNTFLAAHAVPKEFQSSQNYLEKVVIPLLEELAPEGIIDAVDIFHEVGYFSTSDTEKLLSTASKLGIPSKIHADEFNDNKGAMLACRYNSLSCDHLLKTGDDGIDMLSKSDTVATLLPGTAFFLGKPLANARKFLDAGAKVALASDYNPGSCHCDNLVLIASIAAKSLEMNITEVWAAITLNAAAALCYNQQGAVEVGLRPRFSLFKCDSVDEITYSWGRNFATTLP